ncbi:MAG: AAA family ATPase, partial [Bacteroidales bacterium]|nr:AAA family ATPase [Bacteroidales bacterium]
MVLTSQKSFNIKDYIIVGAGNLDERRTLWVSGNVLDVDAITDNIAALVYEDAESIRACADFFRQFPNVFIAVADENRANTLADLLQENVFGLSVLLPCHGAFMDYKCVYDMVSRLGKSETTQRLLWGADARPAYGLLDLSSIDISGTSNLDNVLSGLPPLDESIGGFCSGELSVWTGRRGSGKSTLVGQTLLEAIDQGHSVCAYSGELSAARFKQWISQQAAGPEYLIEKKDLLSGKIVYTVPADIQRQIDTWWQGRFFLYDNAAGSNEDSILALFELAARNNYCSVFMVDNLMSTRFNVSKDNDYYRAQSNFTGRLVDFAKRFGVHVHLVVHPRKTEAGRRLEADDVGGSGDVTNRADNVFSVQRLDANTAAENGYDTVLSVLKNRS